MTIAEQARHLRELRDGYGDIEPEILLDAMMGSRTRIVDLETASLGNTRRSAARRQPRRQPSRGPPPTARSSASTRHCCCPRSAGGADAPGQRREAGCGEFPAERPGLYRLVKASRVSLSWSRLAKS